MTLRSMTVAAVTSLALLTPAAAGNLDDLAWLEGTWQRDTRRGPVYESWRVLSDRTFEGESWRLDESGERRIGETLLLAQMGGEVFYLPKVAENAAPVPFRMTDSAAGRAVFSNPQHDFPQEIGYQLGDDATTLQVWISGPDEAGETRRIDFPFRRVNVAPVPADDRVTTVEALTDAFNAHDVEAMLALVHDDVEWLSIDGAGIGVEAAGKQTLAEGMKGYFASCATCRSELELVVEAGSRLCSLERAMWDTEQGTQSQRSLAIYEFRDGRVGRVYYFPPEP